MEKQKVKLTVSEDLLKEIGTIVTTNGKTYYFMPWWFEKTDVPGEFIIHKLEESLPTNLIQAIKDIRQ